MTEGKAERDRLLQSLRGRPLDCIPLLGHDAVVIRVPDNAAEPPPAVQDRHTRRQPFRLYPVEGAHLVKWLYTGGEIPEGCTVETGGWDHEHCDTCNGHINAGQTFWQTVDEPCTWLCEECYGHLKRLEGTEQAFPN